MRKISKKELIEKCGEILLQEDLIKDVKVYYNNQDDVLNFWILYNDLLYYKEDIELRDLIDLYYSDTLVDHYTEMLGNDDIEIGTISKELYFLIRYLEDSEMDLWVDRISMLLFYENHIIADLKELLNYTIEQESIVIETNLEVTTIDFNKERISILENEEIFNY
ncbi:hypothetical protein [Clostridium perfringens]|uniref:hypothetical protein n=1 Tax=Clostridium perfringens TaxID=1502 RepID=UPI0013E2C9C6|nr:hypothetical protein [Clostridium perfringens]MBI6055118.1 hypothetical protein [Clostridium perfringens]MBO3324948.1 hypothetical protein [Clostridium perfringens]MDT7916928.1 hypothetical protein [Clostridium perfringens]MDT7936140.1 hypothetical protein [Clostridium perfringens]MDT7939286.1 hypothetical protein [Clostridium perfringens]